MHRLTRREFVSTIAAGSALATTLPDPLSAKEVKEEDFSFLLLGDTHFDRKEHHDFEWMREHFAKDIPQVENYCRHTAEDLPGLLDSARETLAAAKPTAKFALHVGDLVEGICGNERLAKQHCIDGWEFFKKANLNVPFLMTKGNHDFTGPGADAAYTDVLLKKTAAELGRDQLGGEAGCASYSFLQGSNLFAVFDAYDNASIDWLEQVVAENSFRQLFVLLHLPVVPYSARSNWRVYHHDRNSDRRQRLVDLLGEHNAIVMCGHLHKHSLLVRKCRTGKFVQLAISSIIKNSGYKKTQALSGIDAYGAQLTDLEPKFSTETLKERRTILEGESMRIEHFEYADVSGFALLKVTGNNIEAEIFDYQQQRSLRSKVSLSDLLA